MQTADKALNNHVPKSNMQMLIEFYREQLSHSKSRWKSEAIQCLFDLNQWDLSKPTRHKPKSF